MLLGHGLINEQLKAAWMGRSMSAIGGEADGFLHCYAGADLADDRTVLKQFSSAIGVERTYSSIIVSTFRPRLQNAPGCLRALDHSAEVGFQKH